MFKYYVLGIIGLIVGIYFRCLHHAHDPAIFLFGPAAFSPAPHHEKAPSPLKKQRYNGNEYPKINYALCL